VITIENQIITVEETTSTNDLAKHYAKQGASEGLVITAKRQTQGRGRRGRIWHSQTGGLYFSILLRPKLPPTETAKITLLAGIAVVETLREHYGLAAELKWPNDVLINGKKIAGILTEGSISSSGNYIIVGIGINTNQPAPTLPEPIQPTAGSLVEFINDPLDNQVLLQQFLARFNSHYYPFVQGTHLKLLDLVRKYTSLLGQEVLVVTDQATYRAQALDIADNGALIVEKPDGTKHKLLAADVTVRRQS